MSINTTATSVNSTSATNNVGSTSISDSAKKSTTDSSFKDEMEKVTNSEKPNEKAETKVSEKTKLSKDTQDKDKKLLGQITKNDADIKQASLSMIDANAMLSGDIRQMINSNQGFSVDNIEGLSTLDKDFIAVDFTNNISMTQADAEFFIKLAQNDEVTKQSIVAQAQMMSENGVDVAELQQSVKISETLLNAINTARENNQPIRIDFDKNISVILRIGKDGSFGANFIPGDRAVEQYLKNNLSSLRASFEEQEIPYSDLSYSNRGSKQQKEQQRERNNK